MVMTEDAELGGGLGVPDELVVHGQWQPEAADFDSMVCAVFDFDGPE